MKGGFDKKFKQFANALEMINVEKEFLTAAQELSDLALDLNRVQMSELGIDSNGKVLGNYSPATVAIKRRKGQPTDHITLRDTGSYQDKMFLDTKQIPVFIDTKDSKKGKIAQRWPDVLGLYPPFAEQFKDRVGEVARENIHKRIEAAKSKILL